MVCSMPSMGSGSGRAAPFTRAGVDHNGYGHACGVGDHQAVIVASGDGIAELSQQAADLGDETGDEQRQVGIGKANSSV